MKHIIKNIAYSMACLAVAFFMASCDTDIESVEINEPGINTQNAELYASYLTSLKAYKAGAHKAVFGWFDNSVRNPASQGQSIVAVPDSLDFLVLGSPMNLNDREMQELALLKEQKGTKALCEISYTAIKNAYDAEKQAFEENKENAGIAFPKNFQTYLVDTVADRLSLCERYGYDGVVMGFTAKVKIYMTEEEKAEALALENDILGIAKDWKERHADKMLVLSGKPQNVEDKSVFDLASYIIIPCEEAANQGGVVYNFNKAAVDGVPTEKFVPLVSLYSLDSSDTKTGFWGDQYAAIGAARFCAADHNSFDVAGLALNNIQNDYYHANFVYPVVRQAISIVNPTVKN
ncbi:glycoside hydrolase family 18 [Prevotella sp. KH2C16]|uniref:glycoside hydrolase family 18 n=1 Tax=Prevotella sp. KH2C16 TaxID=1855325 RepID=UPI0008E74177|nr:glycoside hydrolase family 18 [Prevotella sp. KH2C16]SFG05411.1 Putative glycoside hydrolase Family 18, chitinase_18 [Prevotella sp. KH2C16]